jgi:hypothetical protein
MAIYLIYFFFLSILAIGYDQQSFKKSVALCLLVISLTLLAGLRGPHVTRDYTEYQYIFDSIYSYLNEIKSGNIFTFFEPGFILLVSMIRFFSEINYDIYVMLFFALVSICLKLYIINKFSFNPFLTILLFFSHYFLLQEMTQIRAALSSAIFFVALIFYFKGKTIHYIGIVLFATLFHYSAILFLLLLLFNAKNLNRYFYTALLLTSILLGFIKMPFFELINQLNPELITGKLKGYEYIAKHALKEEINTFNIIYLLNIVVILYLIWLVPKQLMKNDIKLMFFIKCNIFSLFLLSILNGVPAIAFRISEIFGITSIFVFSSLIAYLPFKKANILVPMVLAGLFLYINLFHNELIRPYYMVTFR